MILYYRTKEDYTPDTNHDHELKFQKNNIISISYRDDEFGFGQNLKTHIFGNVNMNLLEKSNYGHNVVLHNYDPKENDELRLSIGDQVLVYEVFEDGWAYGHNISTMKQGILPLNFLDPVPLEQNGVQHPYSPLPPRPDSSTLSPVVKKDSKPHKKLLKKLFSKMDKFKKKFTKPEEPETLSELNRKLSTTSSLDSFLENYNYKLEDRKPSISSYNTNGAVYGSSYSNYSDDSKDNDSDIRRAYYRKSFDSSGSDDSSDNYTSSKDYSSEKYGDDSDSLIDMYTIPRTQSDSDSLSTRRNYRDDDSDTFSLSAFEDTQSEPESERDTGNKHEDASVDSDDNYITFKDEENRMRRLKAGKKVRLLPLKKGSYSDLTEELSKLKN